MCFVDLLCKNLSFMPKTAHFAHFLLLWLKHPKMSCFWHKTQNFAKQINKTYKIASLQDHMRKFLDPKFWSHGTPLGSVGALSPKALPKIFPHIYFWVPTMVL